MIISAALKWSMAALLAGNGADAISSWHQREANPIYGERFGGRAMGIKFGIAGAVIATELYMIHKHPKIEPVLFRANIVTSTALSSIAIRNAIITQP